jgi:predicted nucleic acid-binding protein
MTKMYLIDTNIISEIRKRQKANKGVKNFFKTAQQNKFDLYISVITVGELRRGVSIIKHRGDVDQAKQLEKWLAVLLNEYQQNILEFGIVEAQIWAELRVPYHENSIDKQIAATAHSHNLILVTRNERDFIDTGVAILNPFE